MRRTELRGAAVCAGTSGYVCSITGRAVLNRDRVQATWNTCTVRETERRDGGRETETETETRRNREGQRDMKKREATWDLHHRRVEEMREEVHIDRRRHEHHAKIRCSR